MPNGFMSQFSQVDQHWMREALQLAVLGQGSVEPNPMVGCVLVKENRQIGAGYHKKFGGSHAEVEALTNVIGGNGEGATVYVTLEPCCHFGKTPPCADALIAARVARVVAASRDPHAVVDGGGLAKLRAAGIQVDVGLMEAEARELNAPYFKRIATGKPWVIAKWAMSIDGKIATRTGHSQWISGESSRQWVHGLRGRMDAIVVGIGTALADDPLLTARPAGLRQALRVVVDSHLRLPTQSQLVRTARTEPLLLCAGPTANSAKAAQLEALGCHVWISPSEDRQQRLNDMLEMLVQRSGVTNILVEGGSELLGGLFDIQQVDQCEVFVAPKLIGGKSSPSPLAGLGIEKVGDGPTIDLMQSQIRETDMHLSYRLRWK